MRLVTLSERKKITVEILENIAIFCEENNISYYLAYGSLLGAVRHNGFIPWDDDIDIWMFRDDYNRFTKLFNKNLNPNYVLVNMNNADNYNLAFSKVYDKRTDLTDGGYKTPALGINVDIFPLDFLSSDLQQAKRMVKQVKKWKILLKLQSANVRKDRNIIINIGIIISRMICRKSVLYLIEKKIQKYNIIIDSKYCGNLTTLPYGDREILKKEWFDNTIRVCFENKTFKAPIGYHEVLKNIYGDYMVLPPKEKQVQHANIAYWREGL